MGEGECVFSSVAQGDDGDIHAVRIETQQPPLHLFMLENDLRVRKGLDRLFLAHGTSCCVTA